MKKTFIWDLDGTLIDSYKIINESLSETIKKFNLNVDEDFAKKYILQNSVNDFFEKIEKEQGVSFSVLKSYFMEIKDKRDMEITLVKGAKEVLKILSCRGFLNLVYTHKNKTTFPVLDNLGIRDFFTEILTAEDGFARKPNPEAVNYLIKKHNLDKSNTFFVGDRKLDIDCATNAGIKSILFIDEKSCVKPTGMETYVVRDLVDIVEIEEFKK